MPQGFKNKNKTAAAAVRRPQQPQPHAKPQHKPQQQPQQRPAQQQSQQRPVAVQHAAPPQQPQQSAGSKKNKKRKANRVSRREQMRQDEQAKEVQHEAAVNAAKRAKLEAERDSDADEQYSDEGEGMDEQQQGDEQSDEAGMEQFEDDAEVESAELNADEYAPPLPDSQKYVKQPLDGNSIAFSDSSEYENSAERAVQLFQWLIFPVSIQHFFRDYYEKKPLYISRSQPGKAQIVSTKKNLLHYVHNPSDADEKQQTETTVNVQTPTKASSSGKASHYYAEWFTRSDIDSYIADNKFDVHYTRDIDITKYENYKRTTLNPNDGRASLEQVKKFLADGCSLRFLSPQSYSDKLWRILNLLDEFFGMGTSANSYLTPANTQGFAPHYDDVDVYVMQTEGAKRWRIYAPQSLDAILPEVSSRNFEQDEIGVPLIDVELKAGDFLYAPRGATHQCVASTTLHSLHVTLSTSLKYNWSQYMKLIIPKAIDNAFRKDIAFRKDMPRHFHKYMGVSNQESDDPRRDDFIDHFTDLLMRIVEDDVLPIDSAADSMALQYLHDRLPPYLTNKVKSATYAALPAAKQQQLSSLVKPTTCLRLVQNDIARLTIDEESGLLALHHTAANSRVYHAAPLESILFSTNFAPAIQFVIDSYPHYVAVAQLPLPELEEDDEQPAPTAEEEEEEQQQLLLQLVEKLFESGIIEISNNQQILEAAVKREQQMEAEAGEEAEDDEE